MSNLKSKNRQEEPRGKPGLFRKSTKGKENLFDVEYAESEASVMSDAHKPKSPKKPLTKPVNNAKVGLIKRPSRKNEPVFDVEYAESEASVMSKTKTPERKSKDDSIGTDLTGELKNLTARKESRGIAGASFLASDESDDDDVLRRDVRHEATNVTNPAVHLFGKEHTNVLHVGNKSITQDWVDNVRRQSEYSEVEDVLVTEAVSSPTEVVEGLQSPGVAESESLNETGKANSSRSAGLESPKTPMNDQDQSFPSDTTLTPSFVIMGKKKLSVFNKPENGRRFSFTRNAASEETETAHSTTTTEAEKKVDDLYSSQDNSEVFIPPKRIFSRGAAKSRQKFEVSPNETAPTSQENSPAFVAPKRPFSKRLAGKTKADFNVSPNETAPSSKESTPALVAAEKPFSRRSERAKRDFNVLADETGLSSQESTPASVAPKRPFSKRSEKSVPEFNVSANETGPTSQESSPASVAVEKPFLRRSERSKRNFNVSREETITSSGKSESPAEEPSVSKKSLPFTRRTIRPEISLRVDYEESDAVDDTPENSILDSGGAKNARESIFARKPKDSEPEFKTPELALIQGNRKRGGVADTFNVSAEDTQSFENSRSDSLRRKIFAKKIRKDDFNVSFDETRKNGTLDETDLTPSQDIRKAKEIFKKKSSVPNFEVSANETIVSSQESETSTGAKKKIFQRKTADDFPTPNSDRTSNSKNSSVRSKKSLSDHSPLSSVRVRNSSMNMSDKSKASGLEITVIDKTEKSIRNKNLTLSTNTSVGSYDDDNLKDFMSSSEDEEEEERMSLPKVAPPAQPPLKKFYPGDMGEKITNYEDKFNKIVENARGKKMLNPPAKTAPVRKPQAKPKPNGRNKGKTPSRRFKKPADYATPRLYGFLIGKLKMEFGLDANVKAEELVVNICETVKIVLRRKQHQKQVLKDLKVEMAKLGIIETTIDFYDFIREYLPNDFRLKSIPSVQPFTNIVWPPSDIENPADKIL